MCKKTVFYTYFFVIKTQFANLQLSFMKAELPPTFNPCAVPRIAYVRRSDC